MNNIDFDDNLRFSWIHEINSPTFIFSDCEILMSPFPVEREDRLCRWQIVDLFVVFEIRNSKLWQTSSILSNWKTILNTQLSSSKLYSIITCQDSTLIPASSNRTSGAFCSKCWPILFIVSLSIHTPQNRKNKGSLILRCCSSDQFYWRTTSLFRPYSRSA